MQELYSCDQINLFQNNVTKLNNLIEAKYELTAPEQKIILLLASMVRMDDEDFKMYKFRLVELLSLLNLKSKGSYQTINKIVSDLQRQVFKVKLPDSDKWVQYNWVIKSVYDGDAGYIYLQLHPDLKMFFINITGAFTSFKVSNILNLKSAYSIRMYEILKQYEPIGKRTVQVSQLREMLGIRNELQRYSNFKRVCILKAQEELAEKTDISFVFKETKKGKAVDKLTFTITTKSCRTNLIRQVFNMVDIFPTDNQLIQLETALKNIKDEDLLSICLQLKTAYDLGLIYSPIGLIIKDADNIARQIQEGTFCSQLKSNKLKTTNPTTNNSEYEIYVPAPYKSIS